MNVVVYSSFLYLLTTPILSWNVESTKPVSFALGSGSYFGFSVALNENSEGNFALIAATRANSSLPGRKNLHQPGVLYKCSVTSAKCDEVVFQERAQAKGKFDELYLSKEDNMWLGVSLDVKPGGGDVVACAHLWKDKRYENHYLTNGACYIIDKEFSSYRTLLPLIATNKQQSGKTYLYAFGQAGASAVFSEEGELVLGAPGFFDWLGTVIFYGKPLGSSRPIVPYPPNDQTLSPESYIGYSVAIGRFFELGHEHFVAGAPRDANNKGRVYIFGSPQDGKSTIIVQKFEGHSTGEYFGACVLGVDLNNDSYTDLLVGSPFYSLESGGDEGKIYVYMSNGMGLQKTEELMGSSKSDSRFGSSIANAGDLNQDGYTDVAIGAPYEDGTGAVYIYHGDKNGISPRYAQKIDASKIKATISGFGISISRGKDIDGNNYPDLLIGSYLSNNAFLFRTRPVVKVSASLVFYPPQINTNSSVCSVKGRSVPCFNVSTCFSYSGNYVPLQLNFSITLSSARKRDVLLPRRYLMYDNKLSSYVRRNLTLHKEDILCPQETAYVASDAEDFITPIQMTLTFNLVHNVDTGKTFCGSCPVLDQNSPSTITNTITFQTGCGEDSTCLSDLKLKANVSGLKSGKIVLGETKVVTLSIELQNHREPAYMAEIYISFPIDIQIFNRGDCREPSADQIVCHVGNPLRAGSTIKRDIKFDTSSVPSEFEYVSINVRAVTASEEIIMDDNEVELKIPVTIMADIAIIGYPDVEQIVFDKSLPDYDHADITHVYTVLKFLPSPIKSVSVEMLIPTAFSKSEIGFLQLKSIGINDGSTSSAPASCNFSQIDLQPESAEFEDNEVDLEEKLFVISTPRPKRDISRRSVSRKEEVSDALGTTTTGKYDSGVQYVLKCSNSICTRISCVAGPFTQRSTSATFRISGSINVTTLRRILSNWDSITVRTEGKVTITDQRKITQPEGHRPDEATVTTTLVHATPLPAKQIAFWIVAVSIAAGVILLVLLLLGLIKLGFFKRKKKEDMEKMMAKAQLEEWTPYLVTDEQVENAKRSIET